MPLLILVSLGIILHFILRAPVRFHLAYTKHGIDDHFRMEMVFFHCIRWKKEVNVIRPRLERWGFITQTTGERKIQVPQAEENVEPFMRESSIIQAINSLENLYNRLKKYGLGVTLLSFFLPDRYLSYITVVDELENQGRFTSFEWKTRVGVIDAAVTAWAAGALWGIKGGLIGILQSRYEFGLTPYLQVIPTFGQTRFDTALNCIFELRVGHIILAAFNELKRRIFKS